MKLKTYILFLFLVCSSPLLLSQIIPQKFISELTYQSGTKTQKYYLSDGNSPVMRVDFYPPAKNIDPIYYLIIPQLPLSLVLQGTLRLDKYYQVTGWSSSDNSMNSGGKNYELDPKNYVYKNYQNCSVITANTDDNDRVDMFFANIGDANIDYSPSANFALREQGIPEILNFDKILGKGWVLVYGEVVYSSENAVAFTYENLVGVKNAAMQILVSSADLPDKYRPKITDSEDVEEPAYCSVYSLDTKTDKKTSEQIYNFTLGVCKDYDLYGRDNPAEFSRLYDEAAEDHIKYMRDEKILTEKQIEIFSAAVKELKAQNPR